MSLAWQSTKPVHLPEPDSAIPRWSLYDWCAVVGLGVLAGCTVAALVELTLVTFGE